MLNKHGNAWRGGKVKTKCINCSKSFLVYPCVLKIKHGKFCSHSCRSKILKPRFLGNKAGYSAIHMRVRKEKGSPKWCEICGTLKSKDYEWACLNERRKYQLNAYIRLCKSCHMYIDGKIIREKSIQAYLNRTTNTK